MDVSVIVVNWNTKALLHDCLKSIYEQGGEIDFEVIIIDNASTDDSAEMVKKNFQRVTLVENSDNLGFARANNIGIQASKGRYVCLVNSDVIVLEDCIKNLKSFMDEHPTTGMAGPRILNPDHTLQPSCRHRRRRCSTKDRISLGDCWRCVLCVSLFQFMWVSLCLGTGLDCPQKKIRSFGGTLKRIVSRGWMRPLKPVISGNKFPSKYRSQNRIVLQGTSIASSNNDD